ncbi:hypothetical protein RSOLAG22IIIB_12585 [Rhizoctonia solani]|uniref:FAD-binding FR-type domain-containing protein n=1 Tax=Rhizoctonia solani TaxID=456999 RepID=A0A0K6GFB6_9AGAM|nr:hypothetical protein RSOLAG22IIIB_12585 [Rhizoctonia solani]
MPAFGPLAIKGMFDDMVDVLSQLVLKWERFGPHHNSSCWKTSLAWWMCSEASLKSDNLLSSVISTLLEFAKDSTDRSALQSMLADDTQPQSHSMLDLLEKYPNVDLPLGVFIASLPSMRLRQYSISSSPLSDPTRVTLTVSVVSHGQFLGVASNFLANLRKGDRAQMAVLLYKTKG